MSTSEDLKVTQQKFRDLGKLTKIKEDLNSWKAMLVDGSAVVESVLIRKSSDNSAIALTSARDNFEPNEQLKDQVILEMGLKIDDLESQIQDLSAEIQTDL